MERVCEQMNHQVYSTFQGLQSSPAFLNWLK